MSAPFRLLCAMAGSLWVLACDPAGSVDTLPEDGGRPVARDAGVGRSDAGAAAPDAGPGTRDAGAAADASSTAPPPLADCATAPLRTTGTVTYFCDCATGALPGCVAGDDANEGTSPAAPRRGLAAALERYAAMNGGDTVALCRGGAWDEDGGTFQNPRCSASATCDFRDYLPSWTTSGAARPRINASLGSIVWGASAEGSSGGYRLWNVDIRQPVVEPYNQGDGMIYFQHDVHDIDICNVRLEGSRLGINMNPTGSYATNIKVRHSQIFLTGFSGMAGGSPGIVVDSNYWENNGLMSNPLMHTIYLIVRGQGGSPMYFTNNEIRTDARCRGVMVVVHGQIPDGAVIENNLITSSSVDENCYGIQTGPSWEFGAFHHVSYRRNRILYTGATGTTAAEINCCVDCSITDNVVAKGTVYVAGIQDCGAGGTPNTRTTLRNNSIWQGTITVADQGDGYVLENNAVWTEEPSCLSVRAPLAAGHPLTTNGDGANPAGNHCRASGGPPASALWRDPAGGDFKPTDPGPLVGEGSDLYYSPTAIGSLLWSATDPGAPRSPPIDIGAFVR